jgi:hypothetical protein
VKGCYWHAVNFHPSLQVLFSYSQFPKTDVKYLHDDWSSKHINCMLSHLYSIWMYFAAYCSLICMHFRNIMVKFSVNCWPAHNWWVLLQHLEFWLINLWALWRRCNLFIMKWCVNSSWWGSMMQLRWHHTAVKWYLFWHLLLCCEWIFYYKYVEMWLRKLPCAKHIIISKFLYTWRLGLGQSNVLI